MSKRRECAWLGLRRSTVYEVCVGKSGGKHTRSSAHITEMMEKVRRAHRPRGFRLIYAYLKNRGKKIGKHCAHQLYMAARLSLHRNPKKPRIKRVFEELLPPKNINEGWAWTF